MSALDDWISDTAQGPCAALLRRFVMPLSQLQPAVQADVGSFGARFRMPQGVLCDVSVFGELFIVRVGSNGSLQYRVRDAAVAMQALDQILRRYVDLLAEPRVVAPALATASSPT
jgi:hypothetical protein